MKPILSRLCRPALALGLLLASATGARALTLEELTGTYQGTTTVTLANGQTLSYPFTSKYKANGTVKSTATVNGQKVVGQGTYSFVTENLIVGTTTGGTVAIFLDLKNGVLTATGIARLDADGSVLVSHSEATRVK